MAKKAHKRALGEVSPLYADGVINGVPVAVRLRRMEEIAKEAGKTKKSARRFLRDIGFYGPGGAAKRGSR